MVGNDNGRLSGGVTDLPPYKSIRHNETGLLVKSSDDWYNALVELIDNKDLRLKIADNARQQVTEEFSWQCSKEETLGRFLPRFK